MKSKIILLFLIMCGYQYIYADSSDKFIAYRVGIGTSGFKVGPSYDVDAYRYMRIIPNSIFIQKGIKNRYLVGLEYYHVYLDQRTPFREYNIGNSFSNEFNSFQFSFSMPFRDRKFMFIPSAVIGYRWGPGQLILINYKEGREPTPFDPGVATISQSEYSRYNSMGIGANAEFAFQVYKNLSLSLAINYAYYFEPSRLTNSKIWLNPNYNEPPIYRDFIPDRKIFRTAVVLAYTFY